MNGSDPPSSSATFLRLRPAISATAAPARSEPVSETPCTRGSAIIVGDLVVRREHVLVRALRESGVVVDRLDRGRRLGALRRGLQQDRVADDQVRRREAHDLVRREVPRHDADERSERRAADDRRAVAEDRDRLVGHDRLGLVGVVLGDVGGEVDLAEGGLAGLAHLAHEDVGELLAALAVQLGRATQQRCALGDGRRARPLAVRLVRGCDGLARSARP